MSSTYIPNPYESVHQTPSGPGDARPTGLQILQDNDLVGNLHGKTILVTGGTSGLGRETVRTLVKTGAKIFFSARDVTKAKKFVDEIHQETKDALIDYIELDNASLQSVKKGAEKFLQKSKQLNVLICNAGVCQIPWGLTEDGHERHFGVNHVSHFCLFQLLKPTLLASSTPEFNSRVVMISSSAHAMSSVQLGNYNQTSKLKEKHEPMVILDSESYQPMIGYGQSKTANIWMANEIERRYGGQGLHALSIDPGNIKTGAWAGMDPRVEAFIMQFAADPNFAKAMKSEEQGVATQVLAAVGKAYEGKGALYLMDCGVARPLKDDEPIGTNGYRSWAFDQAGAERLWADSLQMAGLPDDAWMASS